jgi:hypothetical protein
MACLASAELRAAVPDLLLGTGVFCPIVSTRPCGCLYVCLNSVRLLLDVLSFAASILVLWYIDYVFPVLLLDSLL